ncbi:MAG: molybdopterin-dependent oxidoreductase [Candidatus Eisenbacteria bacterium]|nr:molybdopterin-dependent oxidoreductase [Candidatus Eisenbacteria bacterium]
MSSADTQAHVRAASPFVDDLPEPEGTLHAAALPSPVPHGRITALRTESAAQSPGVVSVFTAADVPGENQIGGIIQDEPLLAADEVHYAGQPVALVVAESPEAARAALDDIELEIEELEPVFDPRVAAAMGSLIAPARTLSLGDTEGAWERCATVVEGRVESGGQEHVYLETQSALAVPEQRGRLRLYSATQAPTAVQRIVARVLGCSMHDIEVEVHRLGGAFGGKEDQATAWAAMAAVAATALDRPVKLVLERYEDLVMTGKRHPYSSDYRLGLDENLKLAAFEVTYYQNSGAAADLSTAILERTLFHATNSYFIPNVLATGMCCRTNLPPNTAFRGFGGPQAMFVIEAAIRRAAEELGVEPWRIQRANLLDDGDELPFGMRVEGTTAVRSFDEVVARFDPERRRHEIDEENAASHYMKRGLALMPVCFGISFTNTVLNQAGALVHVYTDGSVSVSTAAVEMGQGVLTKIRRIVATALGVDEGRVRMESTSTARVANTSPTAASSGTDLNGMAALLACRMLVDRLRPVAAELTGRDEADVAIANERVTAAGDETDVGWEKLVRATYERRVDLSAHAFYATPKLHYDKDAEKGHPFAYHVFGTALVEAVVDVLRGTATVDSVRVVHDAGRSLDLLVDRGQMEGGIVQGIGWVTIEELVHDHGVLLSDALNTYKVPDLHFTPREFEVVFLEDSDNPNAVMDTKAIGEPPFMYGIGAFFAVRDALCAVRPPIADAPVVAPMTNERILAHLEGVRADAMSGEYGFACRLAEKGCDAWNEDDASPEPGEPAERR